MNEEEIKKIIQKSGLKTKDDFTDRLMLELQREAVEMPKNVHSVRPKFYFLASFALLLGIGAVLFFVGVPSFAMVDLKINLPKTPVFVGVLFLILYGANRVLTLSSAQGNYEEKWGT